MTTKEFIAELSVRYQTSEQNVAREYCQHLFLSYLYKIKNSEKVLFKGGTSLRIIFKSPRFSEDLDFSAYGVAVNGINTIIDAVLDNIRKEGVECIKKVNKGTEGETSGGYFAIVNMKFLDFDSEIRIQISLRSEKELKSNTALIENDFILPYTIVYLDEHILVKEKIQALLDRSKPRDFFDLYFILRHRSLVKFVPKNIENLKSKIMVILVNGWEKELKIFLPISYHSLLKNFKENLKREIEMSVVKDK